MIVRNHHDGSVIMITQNDHAKLAGLFAAHWGNTQFATPRPFLPVVRAAQYHDTGWFRYETDPIFDAATARTPTYQQVPATEVQLGEYQRAVDMLAGVDRYTGLLVSRHRTGLWQSRYRTIENPPPGPPRELSDEVRAFIEHHETWQAAAIAEQNLDPYEVTINYHLLQVWDLMSLWLCSNEQPAACTIAPVPAAYVAGETGVAMQLTPRDGGVIAASPYPFDRPELEAAVVFRKLDRNDFEDAERFKAAYFGARPRVAVHRFVAGD